MKIKNWEKLNVEEQDEITDKFFKERDLFPYNDNGTLTKECKDYLKEEGYSNLEGY